MTDWPDDWFRDSPRPAAAGQPGSATPGNAAGAAGPGGADATVDFPGRAGAAGPAAPLSQDQPAWSGQPEDLTQPGQLRQPGGPWQAGGQAGGWPAQPATRVSTRPPRPARGAGIGLPGMPGPGGWRRWLRPRRVAAVLAVLLSLALIGTVATYFYLDSKLTRQNVLLDYASRPAQGAGQNWLITGSDSRQGLSRAELRRLAAGYGIGGSRSDTIMVLHLPSNGGPPVLISIPRDSYVAIPGYGDNKINAAFTLGGPPLLAKTVQNLTGLRIDHYMGIGFGGFVRVIDAVGGVRICLKTPLVDPAAGLHLHAGCQVLNGAQALGYVRSRHLYASQDLQRIQNQRVFLRALLQKLTSAGVLLDPFASIPAATGVAGSLIVDSGTGLYQLVEVAFALRNPITTTMPIANPNYPTQNAGDALLLDTTAMKQLVFDLNNDRRIPKSLITGSNPAG